MNLRKSAQLPALSLTCTLCVGLLVLLKSLPERSRIQMYTDSMMAKLLPTKQRHLSIGIVEILNAGSSIEDYRTAINQKVLQIKICAHYYSDKEAVIVSVSCYAKVHDYDFRLLRDSDHSELCTQNEPFFRRHCIVAHTLKDYDYVLFLDADIGVLNPHRLIEEFIDPQADIIFYDRFYNWEIMTGSYLVKNSEWSMAFLHGFANYESRTPLMALGYDNGAIHAYLASLLYPNDTKLSTCLLIYKQASHFGALFLYEACIREVLGNKTHFGNVVILHKGNGWARDHVITNSRWSKEFDFMFHNWKTRHMRTSSDYTQMLVQSVSDFFTWDNPFVGSFNLSLCLPWNRTWHYNDSLIVPQETIRYELAEYEKKVDRIKERILIQLERIFRIDMQEREIAMHVVSELEEILFTMNRTWKDYVLHLSSRATGHV